MKNSSLVSVIIPCYNDGCRINPIITEIKKSALVSEIIVVNDGSLPETKAILQNISGIKLITHSQNRGKTQALKTGVLESCGNIIVFIDSDLTNLTYHHLNALITPVLKNRYHLAISDREKEYFHSRSTGFSIAYTGDRAFQRELLISNLDIFDTHDYLIESVMNHRFFHHYKIAKVLFTNVGQCAKHQKIGLKGWLGDVKMLSNYCRFCGIFEMLQQMYYAYHLPYYS